MISFGVYHRNGIQNRRNSFEDGVWGTTCPIPPGKNFTYILQVKDQIGSFYYFPSLSFHKAAGGFGGIRILSRPRIPVPFPDPSGDYTVLIGDWYKLNHTVSILIINIIIIFLCVFLVVWTMHCSLTLVSIIWWMKINTASILLENIFGSQWAGSEITVAMSDVVLVNKRVF